MLIGLDCVPPSLAFERYHALMPCLTALRARGAWARLRSTTPPITVPAWTAMVSGRDPGELGLYGFRTRPAGGYELRTVDSGDVHCERVWDVLARHGKRSSLLFVPPSYPPFAVQGEVVSCFLTPDAAIEHTYPARLGAELALRFGAYLPDVNVRAGAGEALLSELSEMTRQHFAIARHVWSTRDPDLLMLVEIGPDRLHHAFFAELDPEHPRHDPRSVLRDAGERYYALLDRELAALLALADDDTAIVIASDHGARPMRGCFLVNQWLIEQGLLRLKGTLAEATPLAPALVDWSRTRAWAEGGYYARVFLNLCGREPEGSVPAAEAEGLRAQLRAQLSAVRGPAGERWHNQVEAPEALYRAVRGDAPDLLALFDDLNVRALSLVGATSCYAPRDPRGGDAANHDFDGVLALSGAGVTARGDLGTCQIQDVGVSVLALFDIAAPHDWLGVDRSGQR
jgi:predicted AlkP superfamily phosphohydrolase/phosphomutase